MRSWFYQLKRLWVNWKTKAVFQAVENNQPDVLERLLSKGVDPNMKSYDWDWPLVMSAVPYVDCLRLLIRCKADINVHETNKFYSPLILSVRNNHPESLRLLLENGADTRWLSFADLPALFYAVEFNREQMIPLLLEYEKDAVFIQEVLEVLKKKQLANPWEKEFYARIEKLTQTSKNKCDLME